jgi:hypothetical protein
MRARDGMGVHLLQRVEANRGLVQADFAVIRAWGEGRKRMV